MILSRYLGHILVILSAVSYSIITIILGKFKLETDWSIYQTLFFRFLIAGAISSLFYAKLISKFSSKKFFSLFIIAILYLLTSIFFYIDINKSGANSATAMLFSYPIFIVIYEFLRIKKVSINLFLTALLASIGCALINIDSDFTFKSISFFSFLSPICCASYVLVSEKLKAKGDLSEVGVIFILCALLILVFNSSTMFKISLHTLSQANFLMLGGLAFVSILSICFFLRGITLIGSTTSSILATTEPIFTILLAIFFLKEHSTFIQIIGVSLIILSNILLVTTPRRS